MPMSTVLSGLVEEFAQIVGAYGDTPAEVTLGQFPRGRQIVATFAAADPRGTCTVAIDYAGADALAKILSGSTDQLSDAAIAEALQAALTQAAAGLASRPAPEGVELSLINIESGATTASDEATESYGVTIAGMANPLLVAVTWEPIGRETAAAPADQPRVEPRGERIEDRIDVILDIDLPIVVRFGRTELPIRQLTRLGMGSVIDLGRSPDDPVELLVSDRVVAHGEVVIVGGNYGVRILDVASPSERMRSMEA
jgi:flagellar motor switch protein FliN